MAVQIHLSKALAVDLKPHLTEAPTDLHAMQWYGHRIQVLRRKCVILMELKSRYTMVFTGLTKPDFVHFPELFRDRLWREAVALCELDHERSARLVALVDVLTDQVEVTPGSDRSVQAHMKEVAWELDWMANESGTLPQSAAEEFGFGLRMNETPRSCKGEKEYFIPWKVMREFWLGFLAHASPVPDNVVPFRKQR